ncbi:hypothetical protein AALA17_04185 [Lactobacillaceae bacterium 24-114]
MEDIKKINSMISEQAVIIGTLSNQYAVTLNPEKKMKLAIQMENAANILRIQAERLGTKTREEYVNE